MGNQKGPIMGPVGGNMGDHYGAHKSIIPKASTATVFMGAHGPDSLFCCSDGGSWAWSRGVGGNIGLIPYTSYIRTSYIHRILSADTLGHGRVDSIYIIIYNEICIYALICSALLDHHIQQLFCGFATAKNHLSFDSIVDPISVSMLVPSEPVI